MERIKNLHEKEFADLCAAYDTTPYYPPSKEHGVFDSYRRVTQNVIDAVRQRFLHETNDIDFGFGSRPDLNAGAGFYDPLGTFYVSRGVVLIPADLFQRMLSHPAILKSVIEVNAEWHFHKPIAFSAIVLWLWHGAPSGRPVSWIVVSPPGVPRGRADHLHDGWPPPGESFARVAAGSAPCRRCRWPQRPAGFAVCP